MPTDMPIRWVEDNDSRTATIARLGRRALSVYKRSYKLFGSSDDLEVHQNINQTLSVNGLYWQYPGSPDQVLQAESYTLEYLGDDAWHLEVNYSKEGGADNPEEPDPLRRSRSFETAGGTQHITQGIPFDDMPFQPPFERRYPATGPDQAPIQFGAIGVDDNSVQGVDIVVPALKWTETYDVPTQYITTDYIKALSRLTGTVNNAEFRGFPAGEILFAGASGSQDWDEKKGDGPWTLSFQFIQSPNAGDGPTDTLPPIQVGNLSGIMKKGHEYLWVRYEDIVSAEGGAVPGLIKFPKYVYIDQVYRKSDFSELGIGGSPPTPTSEPPSIPPVEFDT